MESVVLECEYGSRAHGTETPGSDRDVMRIVVEPPLYVTGILEQRTEATSSAAEGARPAAGDVDVVTYPLRKWAALAAKGNPTVLTALFAPEYSWLTAAGGRLVKHRDLFLSREAGAAFLGFMRSQRLAMTGMRNKRTNRPELVHLHGYDTKFAYHMLRLGFEGVELLQEATITLPLRPLSRDVLLAVRRGEVPKAGALQLGEQLEAAMVRAIADSPLPERTDREAISELLHGIYVDEWAEQRAEARRA